MERTSWLQKLHPRAWTAKTYIGVALVLAAANFLGPKGILHGALIRQESLRLASEEEALQRDAEALREEITRFENSAQAKERAIRNDLGYLKSDELSIELFDPNSGKKPSVAPKTPKGAR